MLITVFVEFPLQLASLDKPNLRFMVNEMMEETGLGEDEIVEELSNSLAAVLVLNAEEGAWEDLFELMEPKQFSEDGSLKPLGSAIDEKQRKMIKEGANNLVSEMKTTFPKAYEMTEDNIAEARRLNEFYREASKAANDPELAKLLEIPKGQA